MDMEIQYKCDNRDDFNFLINYYKIDEPNANAYFFPCFVVITICKSHYEVNQLSFEYDTSRKSINVNCLKKFTNRKRILNEILK